ncbi:DUF58 domain-containing protein [Nocardiopsis sp. N85]|uniref:DUF58 domain-containing protein n=1 Tax=Nocardiopsis sp. N85 TaxID=3029400 RepID=UPI00237FB604|nr:DUF58 domain-containing protein [Nocardiopsis sp. N85]MDE3723150.1 DUF58 domain-containing protein [Nocardiopsis sp. N85]
MPTTRGRVVAGTGVLLLLIGVVSEYQELALLGGVAVVAVVLAVVAVGRPATVTVERSPAVVRVSPGTAVDVRLSLRNTGRRAVRAVDRVRDHRDERPVRPRRLAGRATAEIHYRIRPARRGLVRLGPLRAGRSDPLGLASAHRDHGETDLIWVHPRWEPLGSVPVGRRADPDGEADGAPSGALTFHTLRDHVPGDDLRHVHWRSSARLDRLVVREYIDVSQPRLHVIVDDRPTPGGENRLDEVASVAASLVGTGVGASMHCELWLVSGRGRDSAGGLPPLLDLLAEAVPSPDADLSGALRLAGSRPAGDTAILVGGALDTADLRSFGRLEHRYSSLVAIVVGASERPVAPSSVTLLSAGDARGFAKRWNGAPWSR